MRLSLCMIVKNEEKTLARLLDSAKRLVDEIIIVDTGSSDSTVDIAKRYTDSIYFFSWCDDFSKARNFSFSKATGDYIIWLDADDVISEKSANAIIDLKKQMNADVYMLRYDIAFDEEGNSTFSYFRERILKNDGTFIWKGFVHEAITPHGKIEYKDISIEHRKIGNSNPKRNLNIYRKYLKQGHTFSSRERYYYARELYYNGYYQKCIKELKKFLKLEDCAPHDVLGACHVLADCYIKKGGNDYALDVLFYAVMKCGASAETCCRLGEIYENLYSYKKAEFWYKGALNAVVDIKSGAFIDENYSVLIPCLNLTKILYSQNRIDEAKHYHYLAKLKAPKNPSVVYNDKFFS